MSRNPMSLEKRSTPDELTRASTVGLAPNGRQSNLSTQQWHRVRSPEFKAWFGDWESSPQTSSKMLDENGEPMVYYHGSKEAGFCEFETRGQGKTRGLGAFFTDCKDVAVGYSSSRDDAPIYTPEQLFDFPEAAGLQIDEGVLVEVLVDGDLVWKWFSDVDSAMEDAKGEAVAWLAKHPGAELKTKEAYAVFDYGDELFAGDKAQVISFLSDNARINDAPGVYEVFLNIRDLVELDWNGENWDHGPEEKIWRISDADGDFVESAHSQEEADACLAENPGYSCAQEMESVYETTDHAARGGRDIALDGMVILHVVDDGPHGRTGWNSTVVVVYDPRNIKSATANTGAYAPDEPDIRFSSVMREAMR